MRRNYKTRRCKKIERELIERRLSSSQETEKRKGRKRKMK
jgi:hypothetical protein